MPAKLDFIVRGETDSPAHIIVLLHGAGMNCHGMEDAAEIIARDNPRALLLIPNAPLPLRGADGRFTGAYNWFDTAGCNAKPLRMVFNMTPALDQLDRLVDGKLSEYGLENKDLAYFGWSMGGMVAMYAAYRRAERCAAALCHSSVCLEPVNPRSPTPTIMVMGDKNIESIAEDEPQFCYYKSRARLQAQGIPVAEYIVRGLGHGMSAESLRKSSLFLKDALGGGAELKKAILPCPPGERAP